MINFVEGNVSIGDKIISVKTNYDDLKNLAKENFIKERESGSGKYYYLETESDGMKFGGFISLQDKRIKWILLRWLDRPIQSWDDASEEAMIEEYRMISNFIKKKIGASPNKSKTGSRSWRLKWGQLDVSYEIRSCDVAIFMTPR